MLFYFTYYYRRTRHVPKDYVLVLYCFCNKLSQIQWLKQHKCLPYGSASQNSDMDLTPSKPKCWQGYISSADPTRGFISLPFLASKGCLHSLSPSPFLHLQNQQGCVSQSDFSWERFLTCKDSCDYIVPTWIFYDSPTISNFLIIPAKYLLSYKVPYSQVLKRRGWALGIWAVGRGMHYSAYHTV